MDIIRKDTTPKQGRGSDSLSKRKAKKGEKKNAFIKSSKDGKRADRTGRK